MMLVLAVSPLFKNIALNGKYLRSGFASRKNKKGKN